MPETARPLLVLPKATISAARPARPPIGSEKGYTFPTKSRRVARLAPGFKALQGAVDQQRISIQLTPDAAIPERVIVLEFERPTEKAIQALRQVAGFEELLEEDLAVDPDSDFFTQGKPHKKVRVRLYAVMSNHAALEQLLSLWKKWSTNQRLKGHSAWSELFRHLKDVRLWGPEDRIRDTGLLEDWRDRQTQNLGEMPVEIEIWPRESGKFGAAVENVKAAVKAVEGTVLQETRVSEIRYHAVLARLPVAAVETLLVSKDIALISVEDIRLFKPVPQLASKRHDVAETPAPVCPSSVVDPDGSLGPPVVALLDGLPMEDHHALRGRLIVDDPDGWASTYESRERRHGTAMASVILWDDLNAPTDALPSLLYVRPLLRPPEGLSDERAPEGVLWVDLVHRAVRRIVEGEGEEPASAPTVRVVNFSLGNPYEPFDGEVSPLGRLLDWLAWKYELLFVVSAGNSTASIPVRPGSPERRELEVMQTLVRTQRERRMLAPADAINALTVGATDGDLGGAFTPRFTEEERLVATDGLVAPYSRLGRGFRRAVKPDVLLPGGRALYKRVSTGEQDTYECVTRAGRKPGVLHAAPSAVVGDQRAARWTFGTSNAAARTSRLAGLLLPVVSELRASENGRDLEGVSDAVILKALIVHSARWSDEAFGLVKEAMIQTGYDDKSLRDSASAFLGHGLVEPNRVEACTRDRVTLVGGGRARVDTIQLHSIKLPEALNAYVGLRRVTVTLAWMSPINAYSRRYRGIVLNLREVEGLKDSFNLKAVDVDGRALGRGTVHHMVLERDRGAIQLPENGQLTIEVECRADAMTVEGAENIEVPYGLVVSLEVGPEIEISVYDEVRTLIRTRVQVAT